ncbi:hypothetical protein DM860_017840 [Cuscuta australis]|uniref:Uncharacterized protein n=1 Tax=Cuscuta australis TaxID=267555 RepID=A0A328DUG7_9ASTE|nr:hypothetical protein DM860_017840 [Cuscuta australis]
MGIERAPTTAPEQSSPETMLEDIESLIEAARYADIEDIKSLVSRGVSLDSKDSLGRTALHMASANGHLDVVNYLIDSKVDVNAFNEEKNTPLHWACINGHMEVVKSLILAGASVSALNSHGNTPLDEALRMNNKLEVVDAINQAVTQFELQRSTVS